MEALILAGGLGTRLRPLTLTVPKPLVPVANVPIVRRIIDKLPPEVTKVRLAVNYKVDALRAYFEEEDVGREVVLVEEQERLGTGGAVRNAAPRNLHEPLLVFNGDVLDSLDLNAFLSFHAGHKGVASLALFKVRDPRPYGIVGMDGTRVTTFVEKPETKDAAPSSLANAGTYVLAPDVVRRIPQGRPVSLEREVFPGLLESGLAVHGYPFQGYWLDVGRPESFLKANETMLRHMDEEVLLARSAVAAGAHFPDWAVVGDDCRLATDCEISRSVLLGDVHIAENAVVKDSIVASHVRIEADAAVVDCVLGEGAVVRKGLLAKNLTAEPGEVIGEAAPEERADET